MDTQPTVSLKELLSEVDYPVAQDVRFNRALEACHFVRPTQHGVLLMVQADDPMRCTFFLANGKYLTASLTTAGREQDAVVTIEPEGNQREQAEKLKFLLRFLISLPNWLPHNAKHAVLRSQHTLGAKIDELLR